MHDLLNALQPWFDRLVFLCAGIAVISLSQAAYALTIIATLISIVLGGIKIHDRIKYGRGE